ncbi:MAG: Nif3-like dinuclear metal center hexameric protein [Clostridium sp.]|nr:Nif3-like dinuclear metal center hexameric protein [Clostridium sp.]
MKCQQIIDALERLSPRQYASDWDNVGLLVGRREREVSRIMVSLDATREVIGMAAEKQVDMLVTHHPMIFSSLKQINGDGFVSDKILTLAENRIGCYAMHTNFDVIGGMAELAAGQQYLNLSEVSPIAVSGESDEGMGRYGKLPQPMTAQQAAGYVKEKFGLSFVMLYQGKENEGRIFEHIAVMPGAGKSEMESVKKQGYSLYLTGDYGHHAGLDAIDMGMTVIDATHYGLEHIFTAYIANYLRSSLADTGIEVLEADTGCPMRIL